MSDPPQRIDDDDRAGDERRYAAIDLLNDEVVIYDLENNRAWIQSDAAVEADSMA